MRKVYLCLIIVLLSILPVIAECHEFNEQELAKIREAFDAALSVNDCTQFENVRKLYIKNMKPFSKYLSFVAPEITIEYRGKKVNFKSQHIICRTFLNTHYRDIGCDKYFTDIARNKRALEQKKRDAEQERIRKINEKRRKEAELAEQKRREAYAKNREIQLERMKQFVANLKIKAKKRGYKDCLVGILTVINRVYADSISLNDAKKYIIYNDSGYDSNNDPSDWKVSNVAGKYVIYFMKGASKPNQFALIKEKNKFYGTGKTLNGDYFVIDGMSQFEDFYGATVEVIVLKRVDFK